MLFGCECGELYVNNNGLNTDDVIPKKYPVILLKCQFPCQISAKKQKISKENKVLHETNRVQISLAKMFIIAKL